MHIQFDHIARGECPLREGGEEEFVHDACTRDANRTLLFARGMRCHDDTVPRAIWSHGDLWTIVEAAHHLAFRTLLDLISRKVQTLLFITRTDVSRSQLNHVSPPRSNTTNASRTLAPARLRQHGDFVWRPFPSMALSWRTLAILVAET